jgi:hypothetical protein
MQLSCKYILVKSKKNLNTLKITVLSIRIRDQKELQILAGYVMIQ